MSFKQKFNVHVEKLEGRIEDTFDIESTLGNGAMGPIYQARDRRIGPGRLEIVLKCREKTAVKWRDFQREAHYSYLLSAHDAILNTYNVAYETPTEWILVQEVAPYGTLVNWIPRRNGLPEFEAKAIAVKQLGSAIDFMHTKDVVHCDIRPENVLVFSPPGTDQHRAQLRVKLAGFDKALRRGSLIKKLAKANPYSAPEICDKFYKEGYVVEASGDAWAFAVLTFYACSGILPWSLAAEQDPDFGEYERWVNRKRLNLPQRWRWMTPKLSKFFRKLFEVRRDKRYPVREINRYADVKWKVTENNLDLRGTLPKSEHVLARIETNDRDEDSSDEAGESLRTHLEALERCLEKKGVDVRSMDEEDRQVRVKQWLRQVPSDVSLPAMALDIDEEERSKDTSGKAKQSISGRLSFKAAQTQPSSYPHSYSDYKGCEERLEGAIHSRTGNNDNDSTSTTRARMGSVRRKVEIDFQDESPLDLTALRIQGSDPRLKNPNPPKITNHRSILDRKEEKQSSPHIRTVGRSPPENNEDSEQEYYDVRERNKEDPRPSRENKIQIYLEGASGESSSNSSNF